jgi:hypothetical protein
LCSRFAGQQERYFGNFVRLAKVLDKWPVAMGGARFSLPSERRSDGRPFGRLAS